MQPRLPANPATISDTGPRANTWTQETVERKYGGQSLTEDDANQLRRDIDDLRAWDDYERRTSPVREEVKTSLLRFLSMASARKPDGSVE